jgi:hypothetical protein
VKEAILLRELASKIRRDDAAAGSKLFDPGMDKMQEALTAEGILTRST